MLHSQSIPRNNDNDDDDDDGDHQTNCKKKKRKTDKNGVPDALLFKPQASIALWKNNTLHEFVSVAIAMPDGLTHKDDTKVLVTEDQNTLRVDVRMPDMLSNVEMLHSFWNRPNSGLVPLPPYQPKIVAHDEFFASLRKTEGGTLFSTAFIKLPVMVQKKIKSVYRFGSATGGSILYVDLESVNTSGYKANNGNDFVMLQLEYLNSPKSATFYS